MTNPQQQLDPYAEFGGKVGTPTSSPAPDPYAEFGGQQAAAPTNTPAPDESAANKPRGVWGTLTGVYDMGMKPIHQLVGQAYDELNQETSGVLGSLTPEEKLAAAQQQAASEQHKHEVYHSASIKFHKAMGDGTKPADVGGILGAGWELRKLFERGEGENPNDPILTMTDSALRGAEQEYQKTGEHAIATVNAIRHAANLHAAGDRDGAMNALKDAIGEGSQTAGHGLATGLPMVGPAAAKAGEDIPENPAYGLGEAAALLAPSAIKGAKETKVLGRAADYVSKSPVGGMMRNVGIPTTATDALADTQSAVANARTVAAPVESLYSRVKGKVADAAYTAADKGLDAAGNASDAIGRMTSKISEAFSNAVDAVKSNASPQEAVASLQNLRKTIKGAATEAGYTPEQVMELDDQVQEAYAKAHTVGGGLDDLPRKTPYEPGTPSYVTYMKNVRDLTMLVVQHAVDNGLLPKTAIGSFVGATAGAGFAATGGAFPPAIAAGAIGGAVLGGLGGAAYSLGRAAYEVGHADVTHRILGGMIQSGIHPEYAKIALNDFLNDAGAKAKAVGLSVTDYAGKVNKLATDILADAKAKDLARTTVGGAGIGAGIGGMTSGPAGAAMGASTGATLGSLSIMADAAHSVFKGDVIKTLVDRGILPEAAEKMVSSVYGAITANDTIRDIVQRVSAMADNATAMNPRGTAIARAAEIDPELAKVATPAQMGHGHPLVESMLRKQPGGIGEYIAKQFDKPAEAASVASADRAIRAINPETADLNAEQLGAAVKANLPAPDVPTIDTTSPDYFDQATKGLLSAEDYAHGAGLISHTPDQLVFNTLDSIGVRRFNEVMSKMSPGNAAAIRQGLVKHLLDKARDPDTGVPNFKAFKKSLMESGQAEKLGPEIHGKMTTLANGWSEMQDWRSKTNTKAVALATQIGGGLFLGMVDVLVAGADPVKIAALSFAEYAGYKFAGPFIADYFMRPRNVQNVNIFLRTLNNIPDEQINAFTKKTTAQAANVKNSFVQFLTKHGSPITDAVTNVRNQVKDEWKYRTNPPPDVSGGAPGPSLSHISTFIDETNEQLKGDLSKLSPEQLDGLDNHLNSLEDVGRAHGADKKFFKTVGGARMLAKGIKKGLKSYSQIGPGTLRNMALGVIKPSTEMLSIGLNQLQDYIKTFTPEGGGAPQGPTSENKPPFSFKQYLASNAHQYDNPQELQAAAQEAGRQAEQAGHPVIS